MSSLMIHIIPKEQSERQGFANQFVRQSGCGRYVFNSMVGDLFPEVWKGYYQYEYP